MINFWVDTPYPDYNALNRYRTIPRNKKTPRRDIIYSAYFCVVVLCNRFSDMESNYKLIEFMQVIDSSSI